MLVVVHVPNRRAIMPTVSEARNRAKTATPAKTTPKEKQTAKVGALETLGFVPEWSEYKELRQLKFDSLLEKRTQLRDEIKFREGKVKELDEEIEAALAVAGTEKVMWEDRPVSIVHSSSGAKIVAEKLLMA